MGELSDKQACAHKYRVFYGGYGSLPKSEMEEEEEKKCVLKNNFIDRKNFIRQ